MASRSDERRVYAAGLVLACRISIGMSVSLAIDYVPREGIETKMSEVLAMKSQRSEWKSDRWVEFINQPEHRHMYVRENTDWVGRTFGGGCPGCAETTYTVHAGDIPGDGKPEGAAMFRHEKKRSFGRKCLYGCVPDVSPITGSCTCFYVACCCYLPYFNTFDARTGRKLGSSKLICDSNISPICAPKLAVYDAQDAPVYLIHPNLCCFNQCESLCRCDVLKNDCLSCFCPCCYKRNIGDHYCFMPQNIYDFKSGQKFDNAEITYLTKLKEMTRVCCTSGKNLYGVRFPAGITDDMRATLMGTTLLYEIAINKESDS